MADEDTHADDTSDDTDAGGRGDAGGKTDDAGKDGDSGFQPITSQDQLDALIRRRLNAERAKFADYDDAKKKAEEFDRLQEEQKSEAERAASARAKAEQDAADARRELQEERTRSAIVSEAAKQGAVDPDAVFRLLDPAEIEYDESGRPKNAASAVEALLADRTYLVSSGGTRKQVDQGARTPTDEGQLSRAALDKMEPDEVRAALKDGKLNKVLAGSDSGD